jgi:hypothetical protein
LISKIAGYISPHQITKIGGQMDKELAICGDYMDNFKNHIIENETCEILLKRYNFISNPVYY